MSLPNFTVTITSGNLDRQAPDADNVAALVLSEASSYLAASSLDSSIVYSLKQAEALGLSAANDATNGYLHYEQVKEFFRENPNGELHLLFTDGVSMTNLFGNGSTPGLIEPFIVAANGRIKQLAIMANDNTALTFFTDDLVANSLVDKAQAFVERMAALQKGIDVVFMEGFGFDQSPASITDLRALGARNVAVVVGKDTVLAASVTEFNGYAAIGTVLGSSTKKQVHESFAWAKDGNSITSAADERFLSVGINSDLASPDEYMEDEAAQNALHDKGYIFPRQFPLRSGFYWNQSNNCVLVSDDFKNIESIQVINKAVRLVASVLAPHINESFNLVTGGRLTEIARQTIVDEIRTELETNLSNNISSIGSIVVDPAKDSNNEDYPSLIADSTLRAIVGIVPKGKSEQIILEIGYQPA